MSNQEYHQQKAAEAQHRRDLERAAEKTALAAQRAAQSAEMARQEQNASLKKQEELIETNNFRTSVLGTLPLLSDVEKPIYLIQQISNRLPHFESQNLTIINKNGFYDTIGLFGHLKSIIEEITKTSNWGSFVNQCSNKTILDEKYKESVAGGILNSNLKLKQSVIGIVAVLVLIFANIGGLMSDEYNKSDFPRGGFHTLFIGGPIWVFFYFSRMFNQLILLKNLNDEINQSAEKFKEQFLYLFNTSDFKKQLSQQTSQSLSEMYFDKIVFPDIKNEQSFLPPSLQLDLVKWKESTITNSTLVNVNDKIKNIDSELNEKFALDWFTGGNINLN